MLFCNEGLEYCLRIGSVTPLRTGSTEFYQTLNTSLNSNTSQTFPQKVKRKTKQKKRKGRLYLSYKARITLTLTVNKVVTKKKKTD